MTPRPAPFSSARLALHITNLVAQYTRWPPAGAAATHGYHVSMEQPTKVVLEPEGRLVLFWPGGTTTELGADLLRRSCPCAVCRESSGGWVMPAAHIRTIEQAGAYGLRILFDGHESGIYSYDYLRSLDAERPEARD
jgi:DUF971 family protein